MADQKVIITSTNTNGQTFQKTLTDINPDAGNTELKTFAQMLYAMTDNTYGKTDRVIRINCDTEGGGKQDTTLTLDKTSCTLAEITAATDSMDSFTVIITTNSDGEFYIKQPLSTYLNGMPFTRILNNSVNTMLSISKYLNSAGSEPIRAPQTITVYQAESATYKAASVDFTITA